MRYKIGDKVKFLNDVGGGIITGFQGKDIALVLGDNQFETPVMISDLVMDNPNDVFFAKEDTPSFEDHEDIDIDKLKESVRRELAEQDFDVMDFKEAYRKENSEPQIIREEGMYLALSKVDQKVNLHFINDTSWHTLYHIATEINPNQIQLLQSGMCDKGEQELIAELDRDFFNDNRSFFIQIISFKDYKYEKKDPIIETVRIKSLQVARGNGFTPNNYLDTDALLIKINKDKTIEEALDKLTQKDIEKQSGEIKPSLKLKTPNAELEEVDLHIESITDNYKKLSNREILDIQMARFETSMKGAINGNTKRIVFIHGVGNGKLKMEVTKELDKKYSKYKYQDASFKEYGYGATMVIIRK